MEDREYGWDETIEAPEENDFTIFPDGNYRFVVKGYERSRHSGSDKLPPCNAAVVVIEFDGGPQLGTLTVRHRLYLHSKTQGLLCAFFRGIGLRKSGEPLVLNWNAIAGKRGWAKLGKRVHNGKEFQDIKRFIDPEDWPKATQQPPYQQPAQPPQYQQPAQPTSSNDDVPF